MKNKDLNDYNVNGTGAMGFRGQESAKVTEDYWKKFQQSMTTEHAKKWQLKHLSAQEAGNKAAKDKTVGKQLSKLSPQQGTRAPLAWDSRGKKNKSK